MDPFTSEAFRPRSKYPHMAPADVAIWNRFMAANPAAFDAVAYDVAIGEGAEFDTVVNAATGGDANRLYQRRIDVVAQAGDVLYIVEIKPRATTSALGQVKGYLRLFRRDFSPKQALQPLIITDSLMPEMDYLAREEGVEIRVV